jgi:short-subunit dehydrogenase
MYHATKFAVEALSDAMRFEVESFGVGVAIVEPGLIRTSFGDAAVESIQAGTEEGPYGHFNAAVAATTAGAYDGPLARFAGAGPEAVAKAIERAIKARRPRTRYPVTASARILMAQHALLPDRVWDRVVGTSYPRPRP